MALTHKERHSWVVMLTRDLLSFLKDLDTYERDRGIIYITLFSSKFSLKRELVQGISQYGFIQMNEHITHSRFPLPNYCTKLILHKTCASKIALHSGCITRKSFPALVAVKHGSARILNDGMLEFR